MNAGRYLIEAIIENKPAARDPEGETIHRDLVIKGGYDSIKSTRTGKYIRFDVEARSLNQAKRTVLKLCNDLRIYNPVVHTLTIRGGRTR
ncbi:MAG: phosphoribosylformylglycinamidine synthase subunit PurS [Candidatus Bathyarchaeia archaeon]